MRCFLFVVICGMVTRSPAQDVFLTLRPPVEAELDEVLFADSPFAEAEPLSGREELQVVRTDGSRAWKDSLQKMNWGGVLLPGRDFAGLVIASDRLIRVGEEIVCEDQKVRLVEVGEHALIWEGEGEERVRMELDSFHRRRYSREDLP